MTVAAPRIDFKLIEALLSDQDGNHNMRPLSPATRKGPPFPRAWDHLVPVRACRPSRDVADRHR